MVYKKNKDEQGDYKDNKDVRFTILEAHEAYTPQGLNVGWDRYANREEALQAYGLTYDPLAQEIEDLAQDLREAQLDEQGE